MTRLIKIKRAPRVTQSKRLEIVELFSEDKMTTRKISAMVGLSQPEVSRILKESGVEDNRGPWNGANGVTKDEASILAEARAIKKRLIIERRKRNVRERVKLASELPSFTDRFQLYNCSLGEAPIEPGSVDCIITDPPYIEGKLGVYKTLGRMATKWLKPGGSMFVLIGHVWLPIVLENLLDGGMDYYWIMCYAMGSGGTNLAKGRNVSIKWKPILWLQKGRCDKPLVCDVVESGGWDNIEGINNHHWGQSVVGFMNLVKATTKIGDLVCDPFVGGGTTAIAALKQGRLFVGVDISKASIETTKSRIWELL